jgi:hypothetical protein
MRLILFFILIINASLTFSQGANNKFLQLRDFSGGINPNGTFFVDRVDKNGVEGNPYLFEKFIPSVLVTKDSSKYYLNQTNISLISNNFEIVNNNQSFFFNNDLVSRIEFEYDKGKSVSMEYIPALGIYAQVIFSGEINLIKTFVLDIKEPDYRADLNVGSKKATFKTKHQYYLVTSDKSAFSFDSRKDAKSFLSIKYPEVQIKKILKQLSFKKEIDLINATEVINNF